MQPLDSLLIPDLLHAYRSGRLAVSDVMLALLERADRAPPRNAWITRLSRDAVLAYVDQLQGRAPESLPLYGIPFVIKDNIDLAGVPTTAACPGFAYTPAASAEVVRRLIDAGAIPLGKTNLDQFATGLVGVRSPYGAGMNSFDPELLRPSFLPQLAEVALKALRLWSVRAEVEPRAVSSLPPLRGADARIPDKT